MDNDLILYLTEDEVADMNKRKLEEVYTKVAEARKEAITVKQEIQAVARRQHGFGWLPDFDLRQQLNEDDGQ